MTPVDDRARVFRRFNLIDVAIAVFLGGMIPLAYGAYALFKQPPPRLIAVTPATRPVAPTFRLTVQGNHLRPYMRVSLNDMQGREFFFKSDVSGEVLFGDIPIGTYDVVLYDNVQERSRLPKAFTLVPGPVPPVQVDVAGFLTALTPELSVQVPPVFEFSSDVKVVEAGPPAADLARVQSGDKNLELPISGTMRRAALLRINCDVVASNNGYGACVKGEVLAPNIYLKLSSGPTFVPFLIVEIRPAVDLTPIDVRLRLTPGDPALSSIKVGDVDVGYSQNQFAGGARVMTAPNGAHEITVRVTSYPTLTGWVYAGQPVRAGANLLLVTSTYQVTGVVVSSPPAVPAQQ